MGRVVYMSDSIANLMGRAFDTILPKPRAPRVYRGPSPAKPVSWVPSGKLGSYKYESRLGDFADEIIKLNRGRKRSIKYSSRGWCYLLEGLGLIHKGEFSKAQKAINDCRKTGLLPIDFTAADQDETRRFSGIHEAADPVSLLERIKAEVSEMMDALPANVADYWDDEEYYLMMCVEKGDIRNLFKPICKEYNVPIINSKGWYPILLRAHIARLSEKAEERGLKPVILLFYDHDPAGMKITETFRKGLRDVSGGTGWYPRNVEIYRFGLNQEDIEKYGLSWIENLRTGSGRESRDCDYINEYGRRKCECNALFKNDESLDAGEAICRGAIEKYYGEDALERFAKKVEKVKKDLSDIFSNDVWGEFGDGIDDMIKHLDKKRLENQLDDMIEDLGEVGEDIPTVLLDNKFYGRCPKCDTQFNYSRGDIGRTVRCKFCNSPFKLEKSDEWKKLSGGET